MDKPTVGRIVRYVLREGDNKGDVRAAIVTGTFGDGDKCNLTVFADQPGDFRSQPDAEPLVRKWSCSHSAEKEPGTWHWPERV